jgi:hypothetical protein
MVRSAIALIPLLGCAAPPTPALVPAAAATSSQPAPTVSVPRVPRKWCHGLKPPAVVGAPHVIDVGPDDVRAIVAKMHERTDMPVMSISQRNGFVQALAECCPTVPRRMRDADRAVRQAERGLDRCRFPRATRRVSPQAPALGHREARGDPRSSDGAEPR